MKIATKADEGGAVYKLECDLDMNMALSEAMMLGRHLVTPKGGSSCEFSNPLDLDLLRDQHKLSGCALTMAGMAVGLRRNPDYVWRMAVERWPWLRDREQVQCLRCRRQGPTKGDLIMHCFDVHVMGGGMTFEELVDLVRSIEPPDPPLSKSSTSQEEETCQHKLSGCR